jgi:hypothetical protein
LFLLFLDEVLRRALDGKKRGLTWRLKETLEDMEYSDAICLVSHKYEHMQNKLDYLREESKNVGHQINPLKTEKIRVNIIINKLKNHQLFVIWTVWWLKMAEPVHMSM